MLAMADEPTAGDPPLWCNGGRHPVNDEEEFHWKNKAAGVRHDTCKACRLRAEGRRWRRKHPKIKRRSKHSPN